LNDRLVVHAQEFTSTFNAEHGCCLTTKDDELTINYNEEWRNLQLQFGPAKNVATLVDLDSGLVMNLGARRMIYYLTESWEWKLGKQTVSKKEMIQHFQEGDYLTRIQPVTEMEPSEILQIVTTCHPPRTFALDKEFGNFEITELLDEKAYTRIHADCIKAIISPTMWFDTQPMSFREVQILNDLSADLISMVRTKFPEEERRVKSDHEARQSILDPKWVEIEAQEAADEEAILELYRKYGVSPPRDSESPDVSEIGELSMLLNNS
jgi:hypothetical protein